MKNFTLATVGFQNIITVNKRMLMLESDGGEMGILFTVERFLDGRRMRALLSEDNPF